VPRAGIIFHVDAAQATGKVAIDLKKLPVDLMSLAAHKTYGPKGIGALYVRRKPRVRSKRRCTAAATSAACARARCPRTRSSAWARPSASPAKRWGTENERIRMLRDRLLARAAGHRAGVHQRRPGARVPHNLNISFNFVEGESLIMGIKGMAVSSGSACTSASLEPSYVLRALGRSDELAHSSMRMTIGRFTTEEEIDYAIARCSRPRRQAARAVSPLWEMYKDGIDLSTIQWAAH
jgi:cysteine desulfurase